MVCPISQSPDVRLRRRPEPKFAYTAVSTVAFGMRSYSPELGRWINRDPLSVGGCRGVSCSGNSFILEEYTFVKNTPLMTVDFAGLACISCPDWGPKVVPNPGGKCSHKFRSSIQEIPIGPGNGCGSTGTGFVPDSFLGIVSFTGCCNKHDQCYAKCGEGKTGCDLALGSCMAAKCTAKLWFMPVLLSNCLSMSATYVQALTPAGWPAYEAAQNSHCKWIDCCYPKKKSPPKKFLPTPFLPIY